MKETVLHYIWKNRLFDSVRVGGEEAEILDVGQYNVGDGPDFSPAKVRTGGLIWIGPVEMHLRSSDWYAHGHETDPRYDPVILHVVLEEDREIRNSRGEVIPTAVLTVSPEILARADALEVSSAALRCTPELSYLSPFLLKSLTAPLLPERMTDKIRRSSAPQNLHSLFFRLLMRYLGAHQNNEMMDRVASATPLPFLLKHASDPEAIESMLLGQARLFADSPRDDYEKRLSERYAFYKEKFGLEPVAEGLFKKLRVRPPAYPARVLAIAAQILHREEELAEAMTKGDFEAVRRLLAVEPSPYWKSHIDFAQPYPKVLGGISPSTINTLLINAVLPAAFIYNDRIGDTAKASETLRYYEELPPESNRIVRLFQKNGFAPHTAGDTQRMIQLYTRYCEPFRCFFCPLAPEILKALHH